MSIHNTIYAVYIFLLITHSGKVLSEQFPNYENRAEDIVFCLNKENCVSIEGFINTSLRSINEANAHTLNLAQESSPFCHCQLSDYKRCSLTSEADKDTETDKIAFSNLVPAPFIEKKLGLSCLNRSACIGQNGVRYTGISCCMQISNTFKAIIKDLHNRYAVTQQEYNFLSDVTEYNDLNVTNRTSFCPMSKVNQGRNVIVDPPVYLKGNIARTIFYLVENYPISLTQNEFELFKRWDDIDKINETERKRNHAVFKIQGIENIYVEKFPINSERFEIERSNKTIERNIDSIFKSLY